MGRNMLDEMCTYSFSDKQVKKAYIYMVRKNAAIAATTVIALVMALLRLLLLMLPLMLLLSLPLLLSLVLPPLLLSLTYRTNSQFNVFLIKYFKLNNPNRNISTNYVNNNIPTPRQKSESITENQPKSTQHPEGMGGLHCFFLSHPVPSLPFPIIDGKAWI
jgi:hypothetical protein